MKQDKLFTGARFDTNGPAVIVEHLTVDHSVVVEQARKRLADRAGTEPPDVDDVTEFVVQAIVVGAHAIDAAGSVRQAVDVQALLAEVEQRSAQLGKNSALAAGAAAIEAAKTVAAATEAAKKAISESGDLARKSFNNGVDSAGKALTAEVQRLLGGEHPELLTRLDPLLQRFERDLGDRARKQTEELVAKVTKQFDVADPSSPMAQQARALAEQQSRLEQVVTEQSDGLKDKVEKLSEAVTTLSAVRAVSNDLRDRSPAKGIDYEDAIATVMVDIAAGLGDEYSDTRNSTGAVSRSKKGDGVLQVSGLDAKIVVEAKNSAARIGWRSYLDEAERNRGAVASLGLCRTEDALDGQRFLVLGPRRLVMVFDPDTDDPTLLRTVVQVVRMGAVAATAIRSDGVQVAEEKVAAALTALAKFSAIGKLASEIQKKAVSIETGASNLHDDLTRLLGQAQQALTTVESGLPESGSHAA